MSGIRRRTIHAPSWNFVTATTTRTVPVTTVPSALMAIEARPQVREVARHEAVVREDRREPREAGEAGIRREQQDDGRGELHEKVERRGRADDRSREHAVDRLDLVGVRSDAELGREEGEAQEDRREDRTHQEKGDDRVPRLRLLEARNAVGEGLAP